MREVITYHDNGNVKEKYFVDKNGLKQGSYENFYESGQIRTQYKYKDDKIDGIYIEWYETGTPSRIRHYKNDNPVGPVIVYYKNGNVELKYNNNEKGNIDGLFEYYYESGQKRIEGTYKDNVLDGVCKYFDESNNLWSITFYENNIEITNPIFVVDNTIFSKNEYILAYNAGTKEFRNMEVKGFETVDEAKKYLASLENDKSKGKPTLDIDR